MTDSDALLLRVCLAHCVRRLRHYQDENVRRLDGPLTMIERQQVEIAIAVDNELAAEAEVFLRTPK